MLLGSVPDPMAQRNQDLVPAAAASRRRPRARPLPEGDLSEDQKWFPIQIPSLRNGFCLLGSEGAGIIESIQLENFMCYAMLGPMTFGPNVNFVVGQRGKSALQAALIVGLGGKSLGSSLGQFVKDGEASANISITIRNTGPCAFKSEVYGDSITVQQNISVDGSTSYKLKGQARNVVSSEETELTAILSHFNIRVDSPASILPQEMGRHLLQTKQDSDRYKFFLKMTHLEQMNDHCLSLLAKKTQTQDEIKQGKEQLLNLKLEGAQIEQAFQNIIGSRKKLQDLKYQMAWAIVNETEKTVEAMKNHISIEDQRIVKLNQKLEACQAQFDETAQKFKKIRKNLRHLTRQAAVLETKYNLSEEDINRKHRRLEQRKLEKREKVYMLREKIKNFNRREQYLVREMGYLKQAIEKDSVEHSEISREVADLQQMLNDGQQQLNRLKDCRTDPLKRFEPQIPTLLEAVNNAHSRGCFVSKPVGPLGAYIHLRDPEFALAVESCLKDLLLAFCCDNHKDEQVLQELMKNFYPPGSPQPQIIVSAFKPEVYDVTDRAAFHPDFPTVLTALEIDDAVVANALIDTRGIESVLLIKSNTLARSVMQTQTPPKNCTEVFAANGDQVFQQQYYSCEKSRPTYLINIEVEIDRLEKEVESKMAQLAVYQKHAGIIKNDALTMKEKDLEQKIVQAKHICPERKEVNQAASDLDKEINLLKQKIISEKGIHKSRKEMVNRCLDAFDIYMDPVSRRIAMDVILKIAHSQKYQQFILLTSQSFWPDTGSLEPTLLSISSTELYRTGASRLLSWTSFCS
ncbi:structural maintenance of chromosomes protein 6-like [Sminthopsis crassicaudata]|uniref:structural maintenance of chromosomes protein 6-like n=1 Tax=Sminthopsis crassicaudata TaxID=9301 RepID=UPI003D681A64